MKWQSVKDLSILAALDQDAGGKQEIAYRRAVATQADVRIIPRNMVSITSLYKNTRPLVLVFTSSVGNSA